jgi:hypothetical protein
MSLEDIIKLKRQKIRELRELQKFNLPYNDPLIIRYIEIIKLLELEKLNYL